MALLVWSGRQIRDSAGAAINGGKLRVYVANTTGLASTYSDAALTVPLANPVVADANGILPAVFLADTSNYDLAEMTAGSVVLRTYDDIPAVGADGSTLVRDFTNSRFQVRNSGGVVQIETGDPSGDNSGGKGRLGGWNGTQGDQFTLDYANSTLAGNVTISGDLKVGGGSVALDSVVATGTATAAATTDIALTGSGRRYRLEITNLRLGTASQQPHLRLSFDNGLNYKSGVAEYGWAGSVASSSAGTLSAYSSTGSAQFILSDALYATTDTGAVSIDITTPASATGSYPTVVAWDTLFYRSTGVISRNSALGAMTATFGKATHLRILASSGNLSFEWRLIKMNGFT